MTITPWLESLENTGLASGIRDSLYIFPFLEAIHVMALSVVFGTITIVDLRLLGLASTHRPFGRMSKELLRITWGAFAVAALTGALMFITNARVYASNTPFLIKMGLLALAGTNMTVFHLTAGKSVGRWENAPTAPGIGKVTATVSLSLWIAIVFAGRVIGFTTTGAQARESAPAPTNFDDFLGGGGNDGGTAGGAGADAVGGGGDAAGHAGASAVGGDGGASGGDPTASTATAVPGGQAPPPGPASYSIRTIMAALVDPSGDFLFESVADISDEHGVSHKAPQTPQEWDAVRHHLQVLVDAKELLRTPGRRVAEPGDRSANPAVENEPEQVQKLLDADHPDFVRRAQRLADAATVGLKAVDARDSKALFSAITAIDKACESCHLHYWYPNDQRAHQAAREEGGIIE